MATITKPKEHKQNKFTSFSAQVVYGLIAGLILGLIARNQGWLANTLEWFGDTYVQLLKLLIPPLVFTAVVTSVANLRKVTNAARLAWSTLLWFAITALAATVVGIGTGLALHPGQFTTIDPNTAAEPSTHGSWLALINSIVPANYLGLQNGKFNILQILVFSLAIGIAAVKTGEAAEPFIKVSESLLAIIQKVLWWIIRLAPIGTAALIGTAVATYGWGALGSLGMFVLAIYLGLAIVLLVVYPITLKFANISTREFYQRVWPVTELGFFTRSSMGVMPVNQRAVEESMGVPKEYASFVMPLAATSKMDGCAAVYPAVSAIFVSQFYHMPLSFGDYLLIIMVCVLGSAATAGTTGATVMLTLTLSTLGLPLAGAGLLLAVEPIVDMGRTATNVTGQALCAAVVAKRNGILQQDVWDRGKALT